MINGTLFKGKTRVSWRDQATAPGEEGPVAAAFDRIATRYDKTTLSHQAVIDLAVLSM